MSGIWQLMSALLPKAAVYGTVDRRLKSATTRRSSPGRPAVRPLPPADQRRMLLHGNTHMGGRARFKIDRSLLCERLSAVTTVFDTTEEADMLFRSCNCVSRPSSL